MTLIELKRAAKRLVKEGLVGNTTLTHAQALDVVARLHGYRSYHEAQIRLDTSALLSRVLQEPGGLLPLDAQHSNLSRFILSLPAPIGLWGRSGAGKSVLVQELVLNALQAGFKVRILDAGGSYRHLTKILSGKYFSQANTAASYATWRGDAALVTFDLWKPAERAQLDFEELRTLPEKTLLVVDEFFQYQSRYLQPLSQSALLVGQAREDLPGALGAELVSVSPREHIWELRLPNQAPRSFKAYMGSARESIFSTRSDLRAELGYPLKVEQIEAYVARKDLEYFKKGV